MPSKDPTIQKAFKDGTITKGQYDKLSDGLLIGIIKKKRKGIKPPSKKTATKGGKVGTKEVRHKTGKQAHKRGRPKGGSKVVVEK